MMNSFRTKVSLRFFGPSFDPSTLSRELGMEPKHAQKAGAQRSTPKGTLLDGSYPSSYCSFQIEQEAEELLSVTLARVLGALAPHKELFDKIRLDGGRSEFFIGWFSEGNSGDVFTGELLAALGYLNIDLAIDVYGSDAATAAS